MTDLFNELYSQFLAGKMDSKKFKDFKESLNTLPDDELCRIMTSCWEETEEYTPMKKERKREILKILHKRINNKGAFSVLKRLSVCAAVMLLLFVSIWGIDSFRESRKEILSFSVEIPAGDKARLTLPDNSVVNLNSESSISYSFEQGKRIVRLRGEAYFKVTRDEKHPFVVQTGTLDVEVLGTSFNVSSYEDDDMVETFLEEGSVRLFEPEYPSKSFTLKPSCKAVYSKSERKLSFYDTNTMEETAWVQNRLVFRSEELGSVLHKIERWYGVHIELQYPDIANDQISGSFKDEQLQYVLEALKIQYGFRYTISGNNVIIGKHD